METPGPKGLIRTLWYYLKICLIDQWLIRLNHRTERRESTCHVLQVFVLFIFQVMTELRALAGMNNADEPEVNELDSLAQEAEIPIEELLSKLKEVSTN